MYTGPPSSLGAFISNTTVTKANSETFQQSQNQKDSRDLETGFRTEEKLRPEVANGRTTNRTCPCLGPFLLRHLRVDQTLPVTSVRGTA